MPAAVPPPPLSSDAPSERLPFPAGVPREVRLRVVTSDEDSGSLPPGILDAQTERLVSLLRHARVVESGAWSALWFALGAASLAGARGGGYGPWLSLAFCSWVMGIVLARRRARLALRLLRMRGEDTTVRESLRAKAALTSLGEALHGLASWADDAMAFIVLSEGPISVDPEKPIPENPIPKDMAGTVRPAKSAGLLPAAEPVEPLTPRVTQFLASRGSDPPSHPALSRDPDHDPATCPICNPAPEPSPWGLMFGDSYRPTSEAPSHHARAAGPPSSGGPVSVRVKDEPKDGDQ